jgi:hypothetical protein
MFRSRRLNRETGCVEIWECEYSNKDSGMARKEYLRKLGDEGDLDLPDENFQAAAAVCWAPGRTIGNIAVDSDEVLGQFADKSGTDAILPCQIIPCGKFRNGAPRWYCKTHQVHWGIKADYASVTETGEVRCSNQTIGMSYTVKPLVVDFTEFEEIGIWCSLPEALSSKPIQSRAPKIHVHKRFTGADKKVIDRDFDALVCSYNQDLSLFQNPQITQIQITPPAAFEFVRALEEAREVSCVTCKRCGYPHLDLGDFALKPHKKHFCGNCGNDSIWSKEAIASTPLKPLHDQFNNSNSYIYPDRQLNLDEYSGCDFDVWASTPAVLWTADRPQEKGIHVHVYDGSKRIEDDTYSSVIYQGKELDRKMLWMQMVAHTLY